VNAYSKAPAAEEGNRPANNKSATSEMTPSSVNRQETISAGQPQEAVTRFLQLVQVVHGPPPTKFQATQAAASRMVRSFFNADTEGEVVEKILTDQKGAWSLFQVCLKP
jgi:hypothetical protein